MAAAKYKVFVSHASEDAWAARQIARHIQEAGADCFLDEADIQIGDDWQAKINQAAEDSNELLVLLTAEVLKSSRYVWVEVGLFKKMHRRIVWVFYKVSRKQLNADRRSADIISGADVVQINELDRYFQELSGRIAAVEQTDD